MSTIRNRQAPRRVALCLAAALGLGGCATSYYVPLDETAERGIANADVAIMKLQDDMGWSYNRLNLTPAGGTGNLLADLIVALVGGIAEGATNASRADDAATLSKAVRERFDDGGFHDALIERAPAALGRAAWLPNLEISYAEPFDYSDPKFSPAGVVVHDDVEETIASVVGGLDADARGVLAPTYWLDATFSAIVFNATLIVYPRSAAGEEDLPKPIYRTRQTERYALPGATDDMEANAALWLADDGAAIAEAASRGADALLARLSDFIVDPRREEP